MIAFSRHVWLCVALVVGCGGKKERDPSTESPARTLDTLCFGDDPATPFAGMHDGDKVTVFGKHGTVVARTSIPDAAQPSAHIVGQRLLWVEGKTLHIVDLDGGLPKTLVLAEEPKQRDGNIELVAGSTSVAVVQPGGIEIVDLVTAKRLFRAEGARAVRYHRAATSYVILDGRVTRLDESGVQRWATPIQIEDQQAASLHVGTSVLVRSKSAYVSLALDTGAILGRGPIKTDPNNPPIVLGKRKDGDVREYTRSTQGDMMIVARDGSDKILWKVPWPVGEGRFDELMESVEGDLVTVRYQSEVAMFDATTGKRLRKWTLAPRAQLVGLQNGCALVLDQRALSCTEPSGTVRWTSAIAGGDHRAWIVGNDVIVADAIPLHLSRIDRAGKTLWTTQLPDAAVDGDSLSDTTARKDWVFRPGLLTLTDHEMDPKMIDLSTGKLTVLRHE